MKLDEFVIGEPFRCHDRVWLCTDIGTRVIVAIPADYADSTTLGISENPQIQRKQLTQSDFAGPPFSNNETVFDEYDLVVCHHIK